MVYDNQITGVNSLTIFHQNICGLREKTDELTRSMLPNCLHILCFSEHHLKEFELDQINVDGYRLGARYCRQVVKRGGVCIFVYKTLKYINTNLGKYCEDQDTEVCALKLEMTSFHICIMAVYRAPTGNFNLFLNPYPANVDNMASSYQC